ncbi:hypothetical protein AJ80_03582 [Polytolypa hystricis UAMH7299]|uniref:Sec39 domain-containing protein n=1 Tax=Polytolypa hystricis (strain UAMH7299) TaxID=1447883 RepID=A0A2B7YFY4_POLH7|nr:hypothetical protein AJ80_03582 [Polytolypa hystricis UAMH7299]
MTDLSGLSNAHLILLAAHLCATGDVSALPYLQAKLHSILEPDVFFRILLTFLPESTDPARYISILQNLADEPVPEPTNPDVDISSINELSEKAARKAVRKLRLLPLKCPKQQHDDTASTLVQFLIHRAHRIDAESGLQPFILELVKPFLHTSNALRTWFISTVLPLLRFNYEYHPENGGPLSLEIVENLDSSSAVNILLSQSEQNQREDLARDLRGLVGPWMYGYARSKRRKLSPPDERDAASVPADDNELTAVGLDGWQDVNEWLLSTSMKDFSLAVEAVQQWSGPSDLDLGGYEDPQEPIASDADAELLLRYGQAALATVYATDGTGQEILDGSCNILSKIATLLESEIPSTLHIHNKILPSLELSLKPLSDICRTSILHNSLLDPSNPLTLPSPQSIPFLDAILISVRILNGFNHSISCRTATDICLLGNEKTQYLELRSVLENIRQGVKAVRDWREVRSQLLWLRNWGHPHDNADSDKHRDGHGPFWRVPLDSLEQEILKAMLAARQYGLAGELYAGPSSISSLSPEQVKDAVTESILASYDNATNGNKTRGGIKRASETLDAFSPQFPTSVQFCQLRALISATHAMSFYSLTLQHGVPFQPVSIRVHHDPLSLIEKILEQNPKAYTQLDDLLSIAHDLVAAGFPAFVEEESTSFPHENPLSQDDQYSIANRRIISLAISSALEADDFGTAYSYILTRLTPPSILSAPQPPTSPVKDTISWRAAYTAGRYRSSTPHPQATLQSQITHLEQRMELLSLSLVLCPTPDPLPEILAAWRRCDEELSALCAQESAEAEKWDLRGDSQHQSLPGAFGAPDSEADALETERERAKRSRAAAAAATAAGRRGGYDDEAPMGLFEVARGAARAISKNAFPLGGGAGVGRGAGGGNSTAAGPSSASSGTDGFDDESSENGGAGRVRKRDMVSNMVTGGLASGIGWVLGAQPVNANN